MNTDIFRGKLVRLTMEDPQIVAETYSRWGRDTEYWRLLASDISQVRSVKQMKEWIEKGLEKEDGNNFFFLIRTLEDDRLIGGIGLDGVDWANGESFVGIGLGEREFWGKGYGTDAMRIILRYAFAELNLRRVSLDVFGYNPRAVRSYEKAGFTHEGHLRGFLNREGKRWDLIFMGILRGEWEAQVRHET